MITICFTYFRSLSLTHLKTALYSVRRQDLSRVSQLVIVDNDTDDDPIRIRMAIDECEFPIPVTLDSVKHGDFQRTHAWSTNKAVSFVETPWIFFTRADYILDFDMLKRFTDVVLNTPDWNGFVTSNGSYLAMPVEDCEKQDWRQTGPRFRGMIYDHTSIDAGVWMARKDAFDRVGGLNERLSAWGHAQAEFQYRMFKAGTEFVRIPEVLFWHPHHGGSKSFEVAKRQLTDIGVDLNELWTRYHGASPYL